MVTREQIQEIADKIAREFKPEKIILFGSYAWGKPTEDSDVDLCVIKNVEDTRKFAVQVRIAAYPRPFPLDVVIFRPDTVKSSLEANDFFTSDIMTKGKILYAQ